MQRILQVHPDTPCASVQSIEVNLVRGARGLALRYVVKGNAAGLRLPPKVAPARIDGLWNATCFECFIQRPAGGYLEFNLSPSTQWAAYAFTAYREGMRALDFPGPQIDVSFLDRDFVLDAALDLSGVADLSAAPEWRLALSAVIEENSGAKSYWALKHPPGKPDFHHADGFDLTVSLEG